MATITRKQIVDRVADANKVNRAVAKQLVQAFLEEIVNLLAAGHRLEFRDFGVFEVRQRGPRQAKNPKTLEIVEVPQRRRLRFKAGRAVKKRLENGVANIAATPGTNSR